MFQTAIRTSMLDAKGNLASYQTENRQHIRFENTPEKLVTSPEKKDTNSLI